MSELRRRDVPDAPDPPTDIPAPPTEAAERPSTPPDKTRYYFELLDTPPAADQPTPRELLLAFDPTRAHLPDVPADDVPRYLDDRADERLWLRSSWGQPPEVRRVIAVLDAGDGHALERHEGYPGDTELRLRVQHLQDPAQLDPDKRIAALDAYTGKLHVCAAEATRIKDPAAFATAYVTGLEHPKIKPLTCVLGAGAGVCSRSVRAPVALARKPLAALGLAHQERADAGRRPAVAWLDRGVLPEFFKSGFFKSGCPPRRCPRPPGGRNPAVS